ncbi:dead end protein 1-like [Embiotoca jacksoni]|uniref:dead end protein 1-like n=1 Tax=Embiotoca jacksoni TaxID=100190 RepID=UPI0037037AFF
MVNRERLQALETWLNNTNTTLTQVNGQRKYGGPPEVWDGPAPAARCEVFISQIPRDTYEDLLIPLFSSVGRLWEFRLMMNFSGQNRGFAYAKYGSSAVATDAIRLLHNHMLEPGFRLSVRRSTEKRHLCIGDLPASTRQEDVLQVLRMVSDSVDRVSLKAGPGIEGVSAVVAFSSHYAASMAKKGLVEAFKKRCALTVSIRWQSAEKPTTPKSLLLPPPPPPISPPCLLPPSAPPSFCRAVGGLPPSFLLPPSPVCGASPVLLLLKVCEENGVGPPRYELQFIHTGPDGFLHFSYQVHIPGVGVAFRGLVLVLPGLSASTTEGEARRAAAQQVLQDLCSRQLPA